MDFKKLDRAQKIYSEIKELDKQINEIEKIAQIIVSGGSSEFTFHATENPKDKKKNILDSDGSLTIEDHSPRLYFTSIFGSCDRPTVVETPKNQIKEKPEESTAMLLLGVLIQEKTSKRADLIKKLEKLNV